ncbi:MAG: GntR family transcriptional regulator [Rubrobacter sp.]|jgi:GntR family transcriptional regulator|nr:GntR family transcriptional regulator [Rubrobacter sp.]
MREERLERGVLGGERQGLSRGSEGTLYHQVLTELLGAIDSGGIEVGERLPSEADLVERYGVSRTTARRALDELRRQGMVRREPGRGTFLANPQLRSDLAYLYSFSDEIKRWGYTPGARLVSREVVEADERVSDRLSVEVGERVLYVRRLRLADGRPIFVCDSHLPISRFPELEAADYGSTSLHKLFEETTGRRVAKARQWILAASIPPDIASLLEVEPGTPVLKVERVALYENEVPVEEVVAFFHPERYQHYNELSSPLTSIVG